MLITDDIFYAFLQCETKAHLKLTGAVGDQRKPRHDILSTSGHLSGLDF
jgi:hypothetical protein